MSASVAHCTAQAFFSLGMRGYRGCSALAAVSKKPELGSAQAPSVLSRMMQPCDTAMSKRDAAELLPEGAAYIVADTETSALNGYVLQLAYAVYDREHVKLCAYNKLLRLPPGVSISWGAFKVHKISKKRVDRCGVGALAELRKFIKLVDAIRRVGGRAVFHNAQFDCAAVVRTVARLGGKETLCTADTFCTYRRSRGRVPVRGKNGKLKGASNTLLYEYLFHEMPRGDLHDAAVDIGVTAASYAEGCRRKWW